MAVRRILDHLQAERCESEHGGRGVLLPGTNQRLFQLSNIANSPKPSTLAATGDQVSMKNSIRWMLLASSAVSFAHGEVYFLTGSPTQSYQIDRFGSSLFRIRNEGRVEQVSEIASQTVGTDWIGFSQEWRRIVVYSEV